MASAAAAAVDDEQQLPRQLELPLIPLSDGLRSKAGISLWAYVQATSKLEGRDKLTKIIQYGARFCFWYYKSVLPNKDLSDKAYQLYRVTQLSRKAFRMAKVADEIVRINALLESKQFPSPRSALAIVKSAAMGAFWTYDNLNYLTVAKCSTFGSDRALRGFGRSWAIANVAMIILGIQALRDSSKRRQDLAEEYSRAVAQDSVHAAVEAERLLGEVRAANVAHFSNCVAMFKALLDFTVSINMPGVDVPNKILGHKLNDGIMGASGVLSGLTVLYNCWPDKPKVAASKEA